MSTIRIDSESGTITYNCQNQDPHMPICEYHNCAAWDDLICNHPDCKANGPHHGKDIVVHISHEGVQYVGTLPYLGDYIALPPCPGCGFIMGLRVHPEHEKIEPQIIPDQSGLGHTLQFQQRTNDGLWRVQGDAFNIQVPHENYAHLSVEQIRALQDYIKAQAPQADVSWMLTSVPVARIHKVELRPHVIHHANLKQKMIEYGKLPPTN